MRLLPESGGLAGGDQPRFIGGDHRLDAVLDMKLVEDVCDMRLYCRLADEELFADRLVGQPLGHQAKDLNLPFGEGGEGAAQFAATRGIALDQPAGDRWGEQRG